MTRRTPLLQSLKLYTFYSVFVMCVCFTSSDGFLDDGFYSLETCCPLMVINYITLNSAFEMDPLVCHYDPFACSVIYLCFTLLYTTNL